MTRAARDGRRDARDEAGPTRGYSNVYGFKVYSTAFGSAIAGFGNVYLKNIWKFVKVVVSEFSLFGFGLPSGMGPSPAMCSAPIACFDSLQESMRVCALLKLSNYLPLTCFISTYSTDK